MEYYLNCLMNTSQTKVNKNQNKIRQLLLNTFFHYLSSLPKDYSQIIAETLVNIGDVIGKKHRSE